MTNRDDDARAEAPELLGEHAAALARLREQHRDCPSLEVLLAAQAGVLPADVGAKVKQHSAQCAYCQILTRDLTSEDWGAATPEEARRIRERVFAVTRETAQEKGAAHQWSWGWLWRAIPLAAAAAVLILLWVRFREPLIHPPVNPSQSAQVPASPATSVFTWDKLPIRLQAGSVLVWRGAQGQAPKKYAAELTAALALYRDDHYTAAAQQLTQTAKDFPDGVEAQLYLGVARLKLEQNADAIAPLRAAQRLGPDQYRDDATWYLALAYQRTGDRSGAIAELKKLCGPQNEYYDRGCSGLQELSALALPKP